MARITLIFSIYPYPRNLCHPCLLFFFKEHNESLHSLNPNRTGHAMRPTIAEE